MLKPTRRCEGPLSRRRFLQIGGLALGGLGTGIVPWKLHADGGAASETSVILIWLPGGPSHLETYDLKPDAPAEYRGEFRPIRTRVSGLDVCEHLPRHAQVADRFALIRSIAHTFSDHGGGHKRFLTGRDPLSPVGFVNDHPMVGSMVARLRPQRPGRIAHYIAGTDAGREGIDVFSFGSAYLGPTTHPFMVAGDPAAPNFEVRNLRPNGPIEAQLPHRLELLQRLDTVAHRQAADRGGEPMDVYRRQALGLLSSDATRRAFDLSQEPLRLREKYGMHRYGQRCLLARRLVEHGATFVTMVLENPSPPGGSFPADVTYNWDSHAVNCHIFTDCKYRFPYYDRAIAALVEDLYDRGLDRQTLLIVTGEFGRTPRLTYSDGRPGRDHWPQAMSVLVAGGGIRTGQVIGATNSRGEYPSERPLTPNDLWATMFRHLGIDYAHTSFLDHSGRPMPVLPYGNPIDELF
ncbi:MAG: DUF1501 domain-containing protein [Gemmataceae bacterium]|nr:DUF1501 domain-containing protein [Gemmataceae bacterium]